MRGLVVLCALTSITRADEINLFPRSTIESAAQPRHESPPPIPIDSPWRGVERTTFDLFRPKLAQVTDDSAAALLARQVARHVEPAAAAPDTTHDDSRATTTDPLSLHAFKEAQVDALQRAYEEPVEWRAVELEVTIAADGSPGPIVVIHGSGHPDFDEAAREALRRAAGASTHATGTARIRVEAGASVAMPARSIFYEVKPRPKGVMVPVVRGRFGDGKKTEVTAPLQPRVRTKVTVLELVPAP